jgi:hypothetical protein
MYFNINILAGALVEITPKVHIHLSDLDIMVKRDINLRINRNA